MNCKCFGGEGFAQDNYTAIQLEAACEERGEATDIHLAPTAPVITLGSLSILSHLVPSITPQSRGDCSSLSFRVRKLSEKVNEPVRSHTAKERQSRDVRLELWTPVSVKHPHRCHAGKTSAGRASVALGLRINELRLCLTLSVGPL